LHVFDRRGEAMRRKLGEPIGIQTSGEHAVE
jgi:hypothetical protein